MNYTCVLKSDGHTCTVVLSDATQWTVAVRNSYNCHKVLTCPKEPKLSTDHAGITVAPEIITHSAPCIVVADLYTTSAGVCPTSKSDVTIDTTCQTQS